MVRKVGEVFREQITPPTSKKPKHQLMNDEMDSDHGLVPHDNDVLFGRSAAIRNFPGNAKFRELCSRMREDYQKAEG